MKNQILEQIQQSEQQFMPIDVFMAMALYGEHGYYTKSQQKIGRSGDFYTSVSISPVFGEVLAKWIKKRIQDEQLPARICELGAGNGQLAATIMNALREDFPDLQYTIVESSPFHQDLIRQTGAEVNLLTTIDELDAFSGVVFSNEFYDALPVKAAIYQDDEWMEIGVTCQSDELVETYRKLDASSQAFIKNLNIRKPIAAQRIELPLQMLQTYEAICQRLERGSILTIDYGITNDALTDPKHCNGSLRGFYQHQLVANILNNPGGMDITSSILFDELAKCGIKAGLTTTQMVDQRQFLLDQGIFELLVEHHDPNPFSDASKRNRAIVQFITSGGISDYFYILEQNKYSKLL